VAARTAEAEPAVSGAGLFARYAYPPNVLGHCGPPGAQVLLEGASSGLQDDELRRRAAMFDGAWPYLQVISAAAGIADPLDARVVRAYWLGGPLLDAVEPERFAEVARSSFGTQPGVPERVVHHADAVRPSHAFHVFVVYPWVGLLGRDSTVPRSVLETCRVRWGRVVEIDAEDATVLSRQLEWDGASLSLGAERVETCRWSSSGHAFVTELQVGETVSLHWDWVCDRLDPHEVEALQTGTQRQLDATNAWLASPTSGA
jgi:hypothetical protein